MDDTAALEGSIKSLFERILYECPNNCFSEIYVLDSNCDNFSIYRGKIVDFILDHLKHALRARGTLYLMSVLAIDESIAQQVQNPIIARKEFCWLTPPTAPKVTTKSVTFLELEWNQINFCGIQHELVSDLSLVYVLEAAEGFKWSNSKRNKYISDLIHTPVYQEVCKGKNLLKASITCLKPSTWYHFRLAIQYPGYNVYSAPLSVYTNQDVPDTINAPRIYPIERSKVYEPVSGKGDTSTTKIKIQWTQPNDNGADIIKYQVQIQEKIIPNGTFSDIIQNKIKSRKEVDTNEIELVTTEYSESKVEDKLLSPWITVYCNLMPECVIPIPSATSAVEWKVRIRALNNVGWSLMSTPYIFNYRQFPTLFPANILSVDKSLPPLIK